MGDTVRWDGKKYVIVNNSGSNNSSKRSRDKKSTRRSNSSSHSSYGYDRNGNRFEVEIKNGTSYIKGTNRRPDIGSTIETNGGIYKMTENGGKKVNSHNSKSSGMSYAEALEKAKREAISAGVDPNNIDPNYVNSLTSGKSSNYLNSYTGNRNTDYDSSSELEKLKALLANQKTPEEIYDEILSNMPEVEKPKTLTYSEALQRAKSQYNPLYDNNIKKTMKAIDNNALKNGFFGQLPTHNYKQHQASELENQRASAITNLANSLVGQSEANANKQMQLDMQQQQQSLEALLSALQGYSNANNTNVKNLLSLINLENRDKEYEDKRSDIEFNKDLNIAELTGQFRGEPTLAYTKYMKQLGMDERQLALAENKANSAISQAWSRIANDRKQLDFYKEKFNKEYGIKLGQLESNKQEAQNKFAVGIKSDALLKTQKYFESHGYETDAKDYSKYENPEKQKMIDKTKEFNDKFNEFIKLLSTGNRDDTSLWRN